MKKTILAIVALLAAATLHADGFRELLNNGWVFSLGDASSMKKDFTHGTEYFTYFSKAGTAGQSKSPIMQNFDDSGWREVNLPHDWVVDLPYSKDASHSHGYKCVGWNYPENSVGWYRKHLAIPAEDYGKQVSIEFEGIFRDSEVFCNGFYLGHERSGYASMVYDLSPYLTYGVDNVITVRCDASTEEGWYYEGAGIYRNVWLRKAGPVAVRPYSLDMTGGFPKFETVMASDTLDRTKVMTVITLFDAEGNKVKTYDHLITFEYKNGFAVTAPDNAPDHLWSLEDPYLYTVEIRLYYDGILSDERKCRFGVRRIEFSPTEGFLLNGKQVKLKGCDLHLDHAGVGVGVPDELWRYRLTQLKKYGFNAIRSSHNPASPAMLDLCDEMGFLVIDENRQLGVNEEQLTQLHRMIERDRNHPSVILWSIGNEEWSVEGIEAGTRIARKMSEYVHGIDPTRPTNYGSSGGRELVKGVDVFGYNYIVQNPVDEYHRRFPDHCAVGTEETSGAGTRGKYATVPEEGWMTPLNRVDTLGRINVIEHGWKFYKERPWTGGLFYWTGQDYRGEPNPMVWPATGSQFGILDYCCFPKDEAFYLKAAWQDEPTVHICGPYKGEVWVYSNCDEVRLSADGRNLGKKNMPKDGHLAWKVGDAKRFTATGYIKGKKVTTDEYPAVASGTTLTLSKEWLKADGQDVVVIDIDSPAETLDVDVTGATFLGWGNGNPGFKETERPTAGNTITIKPFSGKAQVIVRSVENSNAPVTVRVGDKSVSIKVVQNPTNTVG